MNWLEANQRCLTAALDEVRAMLEGRAATTSETKGASNSPLNVEEGAGALTWSSSAISPPAALETLCKLFGLSSFERAVLVMCAGSELDSKFASVFANASGDPRRDYPTFSLALGTLPDAHWSAFSPDAPLRRWRLIEIRSGFSLTHSPLHIDERVLHFLTGVTHLDERIAGIVEPLMAARDLVNSQRAVSERITDILRNGPPWPAIQLCGSDASAKRAVATAACAAVGIHLHALPAQVLPNDARELESFVRLWEREATLATSALFVEFNETENQFTPIRFVERVGGILFISSGEPVRLSHRQSISFDVAKPTAEEQKSLWRDAGVNGQVELLATQFDLSAVSIRAAAAQAKSPEELWTACLAQARPRLDDLAQRIDVRATWNEIVLPEAQLTMLREIATHVRQRAKVYQEWGFARKCARGLGISALFAGGERDRQNDGRRSARHRITTGSVSNRSEPGRQQIHR